MGVFECLSLRLLTFTLRLCCWLTSSSTETTWESQKLRQARYPIGTALGVFKCDSQIIYHHRSCFHPLLLYYLRNKRLGPDHEHGFDILSPHCIWNNSLNSDRNTCLFLRLRTSTPLPCCWPTPSTSCMSDPIQRTCLDPAEDLLLGRPHSESDLPTLPSGFNEDLQDEGSRFGGWERGYGHLQRAIAHLPRPFPIKPLLPRNLVLMRDAFSRFRPQALFFTCYPCATIEPVMWLHELSVLSS